MWHYFASNDYKKEGSLKNFFELNIVNDQEMMNRNIYLCFFFIFVTHQTRLVFLLHLLCTDVHSFMQIIQ